MPSVFLMMYTYKCKYIYINIFPYFDNFPANELYFFQQGYSVNLKGRYCWTVYLQQLRKVGQCTPDENY